MLMLALVSLEKKLVLVVIIVESTKPDFRF